MSIPSWLRPWHVYTASLLLLLVLVGGTVAAMAALEPRPEPTFTPIQLPTL